MSTPPPFDPELAAALTVLGEHVPPAITLDLLPAFRQAAATMPVPTLQELSLDGALVVEEHAVLDFSLLVARPAGVTGPLPAIYHMHGGGMIMGDSRTGLTDPLVWARELGVMVVSVDYRLAPEHPYPVPVEDCFSGLEWTVKNAADLGIDPARILVSGMSAGGGLAAAVALMARDRGGPALIGQLLVCPMLDDRNQSPSTLQMAGLGIWDRTSNETGWTALLGDLRGGDDVPAYAAPARATDLAGLPPAYLDAGSAETFRDEVVAYASAIWQAGGQAELHVWPGGFHAFDELAPQARLSLEAKAARLHWLRRLLEPLPW